MQYYKVIKTSEEIVLSLHKLDTTVLQGHVNKKKPLTMIGTPLPLLISFILEVNPPINSISSSMVTGSLSGSSVAKYLIWKSDRSSHSFDNFSNAALSPTLTALADISPSALPFMCSLQNINEKDRIALC